MRFIYKAKHTKTPFRGKPLPYRMLALMLSIMTLFTGIAWNVETTEAAGQGDVIYNYPYTPGESSGATVEDIEWTDIVDHNTGTYGGNEQAYKAAISKAWNGYETPDHVVFNGSDVSFYGYGIKPYMDYVFTDEYLPEGYSFTMSPQQMIFHTFYQSGFLFNGTMENGKYTGYALILECGNTEGMLESGTAALRLYYINNETWNTESFKPGNSTTTRTLITTLQTGIQNRTTPTFRVSIEIDPSTGAIQLYLDGVSRVSIPADQVRGTGTGFGFFMGSYAHDCTILSVVRYEDIFVDVVVSPVETTSTVKFMIEGTSTEIRTPETETGYSGQQYKIVQPSEIEWEGDTYVLSSNSRGASINSDIQLSYWRAASKNETTLYYVKYTTPPAGTSPDKNARVTGSSWKPGTEEDPVPVQAGAEIEYRIRAYEPYVPMLRQGDSGAATTSAWFGQSGTPTLAKSSIVSVTFVNLPQNYSGTSTVAVAAFMADYGSMWNGKTITKAWDATETVANGNSVYATKKVIAWATATTGGYDLFIGGNGGVWLSAASSAATYNFFNFTALKSIDFSHLHTEKATRMDRMFQGCTALTELDLSGFDTSNVTSMEYMFYGLSGLAELDVSTFDTSNVTSMANMFYGLSGLTELDVSTFDTFNVTSMANMFYGLSGLTELDVRTFDTSSVVNMLAMFRDLSGLTELDVSTFDTSSVTTMAAMFSGCSGLAELDLITFDTSNVTVMGNTAGTRTDSGYGMFANCSSLKKLDLSSFDTLKLLAMGDMFYNCTALTELNVSSFDTSNVTGMNYSFANCSSLTELDVSAFNMSKVTSMNGLFSACSSLTALDVSNFDTSKVTAMGSLFSGCSSLTALDLSSFDTSKVIYMSSVFNGCRKLTSLDLSFWETPLVTSVNAIFQSCTSLTTINMESADFSGITTSISSVLALVPSTVKIYVGTEAMETWITGIMSTAQKTSSTITVQAASGTKPSPNPKTPATPNPKTPATPATPKPITTPVQVPTIITDTIPDGLTIIESSITGGDSHFVSGQTITWTVTSLPVELRVKVTVDMVENVPDSGVKYDNVAQVTYFSAFSVDTNHTWHAYDTDHSVTEQYYIYDGMDNDAQLMSDNAQNGFVPVTVEHGGSFDFNLSHAPAQISGLYYYGYQYIDAVTDDLDGADPGGIHQGYPPATLFTNIESNKIIRYYYGDDPSIAMRTVTVHYVNSEGEEFMSRQIVETVGFGSEYYMPARYLDSFADSGNTYNYYGYELTETVGTPKEVGLQADRSILTNAPQFADIQNNEHITLYFTDTPTVTVHFVEYKNAFNVLKTSQTYFVGSDGTFTPPAELTDDIDLLMAVLENGDEVTRLYKYVSYWSLDSGTTLNTGNPTVLKNVTDNRDLTLYFRTEYLITEMFHPNDTSGTDLLPPVETSVYGGESFSGNPPATISYGGDTWNYIGYRVGNDDSNALNYGYPPNPMINSVNDDFFFIYVYEKNTSGITATKNARVSANGTSGWSSYVTGTAASPISVSNGYYIDYRIQASGFVGTNITVTVTDLLPEGLEYVSIPTATSGFTAVTNTVGNRTEVKWTRTGTFTAGTTYTFYVRVKVNTASGNFINTAQVDTPTSTIITTPTYHRVGFVITEQFRQLDAEDNILYPNRSFPFTGQYNENPENLLSMGWTYVGYKLNNGTFVSSTGNPADTIIASVTGAATITYLYKPTPLLSAEKLLHIRQIVINPAAGLETPVMGYYTLTNNNNTLPLTSDSLVLPEFTDYVVNPSGGGVFTVCDIVPQYYKYYGYVASYDDEGDHPNAESPVIDTQLANGLITMDYNEADEYWLTIYITPTGTPGDYEWGYATNEFGTVNAQP